MTTGGWTRYATSRYRTSGPLSAVEVVTRETRLGVVGTKSMVYGADYGVHGREQPLTPTHAPETLSFL